MYFLMFLFISLSQANESTVHSYSGLDFCKTTAEKQINDLDKLLEGDTRKINELTSQVNDLNAHNAMINDFLKLRKNYLESLENTKDLNQKKTEEQLDEFKNLISSSLHLSLVNTIVKSTGSLPDETSLERACNVALGKEVKDEKVSDFCNKFRSSKELHFLGETKIELAYRNVKLALKNSNDPNTLKSDLNKIYNEIPSKIEPIEVLNKLYDTSPVFSKVLASDTNKDNILKCLKVDFNTKYGCNELLSLKENAKSISSIFTSEMNAISKDLFEKKFMDVFKDRENLIKLKNENPLKAQYENSFNSLSKDLIPHLNLSDINLDLKGKNLLNEFNKNCAPELVSVDNSKCEDSTNILKDFLNDQKEVKEKLVTNRIDEAKSMLQKDGNLHTLLSLRKFVVEKYMRECPSHKHTFILPSCNIVNLLNDSEKIEKLGLDVNYATSHIHLKNKRGELGIFKKDEISEFKSTCENTELLKEKLVADICQEITEREAELSVKKETHELDEINKKYNLEYNPNVANNYTVKRKRSNWNLAGEGLVYGINYALPIWLQNMQMDSQIEFMTNQALYQKQYNYMNSPDSPWQSTPYFLGNYYQFNNVPSNTGFNFGN